MTRFSMLPLALAAAAALAACGAEGDATTTHGGAATVAPAATHGATAPHANHDTDTDRHETDAGRHETGGDAAHHGAGAHGARGGHGPSQMAGAMRTLARHEHDGMRIEVIAMEPETFTVAEGTKTVVHRPRPSDNAHLMVTLTDVATGERIPYSSVQIALSRDGRRVVDTRLWPMISRHVGAHYGENVALPTPGRYEAVVTVGAPQVARHPELADRWTRAQRVTFALDWRGVG